jgi:peptidoglycan pentaglycine glycine transferase (the first glycine)
MISSLTRDEWNKKTIELGGSILQSFEWGMFQESLGYKIFRFSGDDFANLAVQLPLPLNKKYLYSTRGPLGNSQAALDDLAQLGKDPVLVFARIEPQVPLKDLPKAVKDIQPTNNWMLNLEKTEEELLIGMKPKTRYNINLADRKGVKVREGTKDDLLVVWQLLLETAARNGFRLHPQNYYWQMHETLAQHNLKILVAEYNHKPVAGMLLTIFGDTATYLHGGSSNEYKQVMAPYLLHWQAIKLCKNLHLKTYDFGGIAPSGANDHAWAGISRFKKSFGGFEVIYPGAYDLVLSPVWYNVYKNARALRRIIKR